MIEESEFKECSNCHSKTGSPTLCEGCLSNRLTISLLRQKIEDLEEDRRITEHLLEEKHRLLKAIPACEIHGEMCVPHAIEWIERVKSFGKIIFKEER